MVSHENIQISSIYVIYANITFVKIIVKIILSLTNIYMII